MAYGIEHPERCAGFVLRGIFLGRDSELDWFLDGMKAVFPEDSWVRRHLQIIYSGREHCPALRHDLTECPICSWAATKKRIREEMGV